MKTIISASMLASDLANIEKEIVSLQDQNNRYDQNEGLAKDLKEKTETLTKNQMAQASILEKTLNDKMADLNSYIFYTNKISERCQFVHFVNV